MELTERVPMKPIQWLSQLSFKEFSQKCPTKTKGKLGSKILTATAIL